MECPNYKNVSKYISVCSILRDEFNIQYIQSLSRAGCPCHKCKNEWIDEQPPTKDSLTTPMKAIVKANGKIELPTIAEQVTSYVSAIANWAFDGFANMPEVDYKNRVDCCVSNRCGLYDKELDKCNGCGCKIQDTNLGKGKARYPLELCPADQPEWKNTLGVEYTHQPNPAQKCRSCGQT